MRTIIPLLVGALHAGHCFLLAPRIPAAHAKTHQSPRASAIVSELRPDQLRAAGAAALASLVLLSSPMPALAKGGGGGGSGGGHYSSSSSSPRALHKYTTNRAYSSSLGHTSTVRSTSTRKRSSRSRSSGYSSSSRVQSYRATASPPPPPSLLVPSTKTIALFPDESTAREEGGYYCPANLPRPGERVEVEGRTATVVV